MRIGFIGTGAITEALVTGLCTSGQEVSIRVSPRNRNKAEVLQRRFSQVTVGRSNQDVVDNSEIVFLAFLPRDCGRILGSLRFRDRQVVINLLGGTQNSQIAAHIDSPCFISRAVPLPYAAEHIGPIAVFPDNGRVNQLLDGVGTVISLENEEQLEYLSVITSLMAPYFQMLATITDWAAHAGVDQKKAAEYTASMFEALSVLARKSSGTLHQLADESMTPGGLNELARKIINESGGFEFLKPALQAVACRVRGEENGQKDEDSQ